jgi:hypothetical protein
MPHTIAALPFVRMLDPECFQPESWFAFDQCKLVIPKHQEVDVRTARLPIPNNILGGDLGVVLVASAERVQLQRINEFAGDAFERPPSAVAA